MELEIAGNAVIFCDDKSPSRHSENCKNNFLEEGSTDDVSVSAAELEEIFSINFTKSNTKLCLNLPYNGYESCLYVNKRGTCNFRRFYLGDVFKKFKINETKKMH